MALDTDTVRRVAQLARIHVPDDELAALADELNHILGWVEQLGEVETDAIAPLASVADIGAALRTDVITDGDDAARVLANAPDTADGYFRVQKVIE